MNVWTLIKEKKLSLCVCVGGGVMEVQTGREDNNRGRKMLGFT